MQRARFQLGLGDGCYGPGDVEPFIVEVVRNIRGPDLPNGAGESLLAVCERPFDWHGEEVQYVIVSPRHSTVSLSSITLRGGIVAVGRVRPGHDPVRWPRVDHTAVHYWAVGVATLVDAMPQPRQNEA